ncbi:MULTISPECIES: MarR family winged helix-turn-helix transcriptional regulator [unclassified Novosphingobium]|uniref:MarR family winged helix-turn-helix transcriptional regulator n=1 Tax=unclassified Novosphingobium TaxID=2644732 RepID=UPI001356D14B|nr:MULTISPECIES: MarR family transcriptional regulator [unclassified Novosphingobium]
MKLEQMTMLPAHLMRRCLQMVTVYFADELAGYEMTQVQYATLTAICNLGECDATRVGKSIGLDKVTVGLVVKRLHARGLLAISQQPGDRRVRLLTLTVEARRILEDVEEKVLRAQERLLDPLGPEQRSALITALRTIVDSG